MNITKVKAWLLFGGGFIVALFFIWFGILLLFYKFNASPLLLFLLGSAATLASVFTLTSQISAKLPVGGVLILIGLYYFARASGQVTSPILGTILGAASLLAAGIVLYVTYPKSPR